MTENNGQNMWSKMLKENFNVTDENKLAWVSQYAAIHEIHESSMPSLAGQAQAMPAGVGGGYAVGGAATIPANAVNGAGPGVSPLYATPLNTVGMGNVAAPSPLPTDTTAPGNFWMQGRGSGDIPVSTLPMALNIALLTIGLELVPVIPSKGPWQLLTYMDFPYAGGKLGKRNEIAGLDGVGNGRENKPLYFKVVVNPSVLTLLRAVADENGNKGFAEGNSVSFKFGDKANVQGVFKGFGKMDGGLLLETVFCHDGKGNNISLVEAFHFAKTEELSLKVAIPTGDTTVAATWIPVELDEAAKEAFACAKVDFVQTHVDLIDGFANFATGKKEAMTRAQNETGTGNVIGLRLFSKWVQMGAYEVTGTVTRQQLQDLPLYGVNAVAKVMEAMQNEITQHINQRILEHVFALGVTNAVKQRQLQGVDFNLQMGTTDLDMSQSTIAHYTDIFGVDHKNTWGAIKNAEVNTSAENLHTRQRRISSRVLGAANLIMVTGRRGRATWIVTNAQIATALQDCSGYVVAPMVNNMAQDGSQNLYLSGRLAGLNVYVDPYMAWDDTRICVGRKGNGNEPGVIFMPYILADTVSITAEGTMAPKMLLNSRFAIVDAGFFPENQYYTFSINSPEFGLL